MDVCVTTIGIFLFFVFLSFSDASGSEVQFIYYDTPSVSTDCFLSFFPSPPPRGPSRVRSVLRGLGMEELLLGEAAGLVLFLDNVVRINTVSLSYQSIILLFFYHTKASYHRFSIIPKYHITVFLSYQSITSLFLYHTKVSYRGRLW
ncbi:hypothetical protein HOY80DRAFT_281231 [Tuber brumale]|nr:hypothetical protein HOY80DRAFT_281231 [Tuber brumale]